MENDDKTVLRMCVFNEKLQKVKNGLDCCINYYLKNCTYCQYKLECDHHEACNPLIQDALSVITTLELENKRLKK